MQDIMYDDTPTRERLVADAGVVAARTGFVYEREEVGRLLGVSGGRVVKGGRGAPGVQVVDGRVVVFGDVVGLVDLKLGDEEGVKSELREVGRMGDWLVVVLDVRDGGGDAGGLQGVSEVVEGGGVLESVGDGLAVGSQRGDGSVQASQGLSAHGSQPGSQAGSVHEVVVSEHGSQRGDGSIHHSHPGSHAGPASVQTQPSRAPSIQGSQAQNEVPLVNIPEPIAGNADAAGSASIRGSQAAGPASVHGMQTPPASEHGSAAPSDGKGEEGP